MWEQQTNQTRITVTNKIMLLENMSLNSEIYEFKSMQVMKKKFHQTNEEATGSIDLINQCTKLKEKKEFRVEHENLL